MIRFRIIEVTKGPNREDFVGTYRALPAMLWYNWAA